MGRKYKITIEVEYEKGYDADPSGLLDSVQDNIEELLTPYDEKVEHFDVCVEDKDEPC